MKKRILRAFILSFILAFISPILVSTQEQTVVQAAVKVPVPRLVSVNANTKQVQVKWRVLDDVDGYRVLRKSSGTRWTTIGTIKDSTVNSYLDTTAEAGKTYQYSVRAFKKENGKIVLGSYNQTGLKVTTPPPAPKLVSAKASGTSQVTFTWKRVPSATGYRVFRKKYGTSTWKAVKTITSPTVVSYVDKKAEMGVPYYYTVRAYTSVGNKILWGTYDTAGKMANSKITAPKLVAASGLDNGDISFSWTHSGAVSGYRIYRKIAGEKWTLCKNGFMTDASGAYTFSDVSCEPGQTYYYTARAYVTTNGKTVLSNYNSTGVKATAKVPMPSEITAAWGGASETGIKVDVAWDAQEDVDGYYVYRREYSSGKWQNWKAVGTVNDKQICSFEDTTVVLNSRYRYTLRSFCNIDGKVVRSSYDPNGSEIHVKIPVPQNVTIEETGKNQVAVMWKPVDGVAGYRIYRNAGTGWSVLGEVNDPNASSYTSNAEVEEGTEYSYAVRAYIENNGTKNLSSYKAVKVTSKIYYPEQPILVSATATSSTSVTVKWQIGANTTGCVIYRKENGTDNWEKIATLSESDSSFLESTYVDTQVDEEQTYFYSVAGTKVVNGSVIESAYDKAGVQATTFRGTLRLSDTELYMAAGEVSAIRLKGTSLSPEWTSTDPTVAMVSGGTIEAMKAGTADIVAEFEGEKYICKLTVEAPVISTENLEMPYGSSKILSVSGTTQPVNWSCESGYIHFEPVNTHEVKVMALKAGTYIISANVTMTKTTITLRCQLTVKGSIVPDKTQVTVKIGNTVKLPVDSDYPKLYSRSANRSVATSKWVSASDSDFALEITGKAAGKTTIRIYSDEPVVEKIITVIVEDENAIEANNKKLKNYIWNNGEIVDSTYRYVAFYAEQDGLIITWSIGYESTSDFFTYSMSAVPADNPESEYMVVSISTNVAQTNRVFVGASMVSEIDGESCELETTIYADTYSNQEITFNVIESSGMTAAEIKEIKEAFNDLLRTAFQGWEIFILENEVGISFKDLGFKSYAA